MMTSINWSLYLSHNGLYIIQQQLKLFELSIFIILVYYFLRNEIAYSSSDKLVYIRHFSPSGFEMKLKSILQGHDAEVTQVCHYQLLIALNNSLILCFITTFLICCVYPHFFATLSQLSLNFYMLDQRFICEAMKLFVVKMKKIIAVFLQAIS